MLSLKLFLLVSTMFEQTFSFFPWKILNISVSLKRWSIRRRKNSGHETDWKSKQKSILFIIMHLSSPFLQVLTYFARTHMGKFSSETLGKCGFGDQVLAARLPLKVKKMQKTSKTSFTSVIFHFIASWNEVKAYLHSRVHKLDKVRTTN